MNFSNFRRDSSLPCKTGLLLTLSSQVRVCVEEGAIYGQSFQVPNTMKHDVGVVGGNP